MAEQNPQLKLPGGCHACFNAEFECYFAMTELPRQLARYISEEIGAASDGRSDLACWCRIWSYDLEKHRLLGVGAPRACTGRARGPGNRLRVP